MLEKPASKEGFAFHATESHCAECDVRACVASRVLPNCAHCKDYGCQTITKFFEWVPAAKEQLDAIRASLG